MLSFSLSSYYFFEILLVVKSAGLLLYLLFDFFAVGISIGYVSGSGKSKSLLLLCLLFVLVTLSAFSLMLHCLPFLV